MSGKAREAMSDEWGAVARRRTVVYCIVPRDLAERLHEPLRRHFRDDPSVEVIVEARARERRSGAERRSAPARPERVERRRIRSLAGRRIGERRAALVPVEPLPLPRRARAHAGRLVFVERVEPGGQPAEDLDTTRLVMRFQAGDRDAFSDLYLRHFDRVYSYLRVAFKGSPDAEDVTQQVFMDVLQALPRYEHRGRPFRTWLFRVVRNHALTYLARENRLELMDPAELRSRRESEGSSEADLEVLGWLVDRELVLFVERLPLAQQQVLVLRYMLGFATPEIAAILGRSPDAIRMLQHRALAYLRERLTALGRRPERGGERTRDSALLRPARVVRVRRFALRYPGPTG